MSQSTHLPARSSALLTIDLDAVAANYARLNAEAPGAEVSAVVKTNAYGLGVAPVAERLAAEGVTTYFVAHVGEGVELRTLADARLDRAKVYVLGGLSGAPVSLFLHHNLTPALATPSDVEGWSAAARAAGRPLPCALHFDTGMNRLGLPAAEAERLAENLGLQAELVMSHLACADEPTQAMNAAQLQRFERVRALFPSARASLANSSGVFLGRPYQFDLVRPGMALYGLNPTPGRPNPMKTAIRLEAPILQLRQIDRGESVGYGASFRPEGKIAAATIGVGYGDGFPRALSNKGWGYLRGCRLPIIGRISMDLMTLDVSGVGPQPARVGEPIELLGPAVPPDDVGLAAGTLGYEILTNLGPRYRRRYAGERGHA